jgi:hypothetical protein
MNRPSFDLYEAVCALLLPTGSAILLGAGALFHIGRGGSLLWLVVPLLATLAGAWWRRHWERRYAQVIDTLCESSRRTP